MKQVVQDVRSGVTRVAEIPAPIALPGTVVVAQVASLVSAGTEKSVVELARKGLLAKARQRPDHVKRVLQKLRQEGLVSTFQQVQAKLDEPLALGYSGSGVVLECGRGVSELKPGDRVATVAPHAGVVVVGRNLCARLPDEVTFEQGAYGAVGAIALEGVRLARATLGERVLVIGLGLIGQIAVGLLKAQGCKVYGVDPDASKVELAAQFGIDRASTVASREELLAFASGVGVDAVLITASTQSNQPIEFAAEIARPRGRIVLVGVAGTTLPRAPFFTKELEFTVSGSLGPGRWDPAYEERGHDYPFGHVRWTAQRNLQTVVEMVATARLPVERLTTHRFQIENGAEAYDLITSGREPYVGIILNYPQLTASSAPARRTMLSAPAPRNPDLLGLGMVGAGNFARLVLLPALLRERGYGLRGLCSARGLSAASTGAQLGFDYSTTDFEELLTDDDTDAVFIATRHDQHASMVMRALRAGKHVFVEKPLCITLDELEGIAQCVEELGDSCPVLTVGFNRRFAPGTAFLRQHFERVAPLTVSYRFAAASLPETAWPQDEDIGGGRIVGEACHAIDLCSAITGAIPIRVFAESVRRTVRGETSDDKVFITLAFDDGSAACVSYQTGGDRAGPKERIEVFGGTRTGVIDEWASVRLWSDGKETTERAGRHKGHAEEVSAFLAACRSGGDWPIPWAQLYGVAWASIAAVTSLRQGYPVSIVER